ATRGLAACERACASIRTVFAGQVGLAGVTLVETTATPLPTLAPGTLKLTWLMVAAVLPICRISLPPPFPMATVAACAPADARARAMTSVSVRVMASRKGRSARAVPALPLTVFCRDCALRRSGSIRDAAALGARTVGTGRGDGRVRVRVGPRRRTV